MFSLPPPRHISTLPIPADRPGPLWRSVSDV